MRKRKPPQILIPITTEEDARVWKELQDDFLALWRRSAMSVVNVKNAPYDVYIGRRNKSAELEASVFANPYVIGRGVDREMALGLYFWHLVEHPDIVSQIYSLYGKRLGCWCYPAACHGDLLLHIAAGKFPDITTECWFQQCTECEAPAFFWKPHITNPPLYINAENPYALDYGNYTHLNGTYCVPDEAIRCPVCQVLTGAMFDAAQMRYGSLRSIASTRLRPYRG